MVGLPPVLCVSVTVRHKDPPAGITSGSWLALVVTVNGLVGFAPAEPKVVDHVLRAFGITETKPAQLAVAETPTFNVTVSLVEPFPPVKYMVKLHVPAATVCAGRPVKAHVAETPPDCDCISQAVPRVPTAASI